VRHAILGAGGVGGLMGACLAHGGFPVTIVLRPESVAGHPSNLHLQSPFGEFRERVEKATSVPPTDVLWVAVKATQLDQALSAIRDPDSVGSIVPLLNGIEHVDLLRSKYGSRRVVPASIGVESERVGPGEIVQRSPFAQLSVSSSGRKPLESTLSFLQTIGFTCRFADDEATLLWSKLVFLAPFALVTTANSMSKGEILADARTVRQAQECIREVCEVAQAEGATVNPTQVISFFTGLPEKSRSSMQKDVDHGRPPEVDAIGGVVIRAAARHGIDVPVTRALMAGVLRRAVQSF
jgi:2-dehydropantoate 2-reductase